MDIQTESHIFINDGVDDADIKESDLHESENESDSESEDENDTHDDLVPNIPF